MFTICSGDTVDIQPDVQKERPVRNNFVQTDPLLIGNADCQIPETKSAQVQTEVTARQKTTTVEFDPDSLLSFLNKVTPLVCSVLEKNSNSHAFDRYKLLSDIDSTSTHQLYSLENDSFSNEVSCADASWNSTGTALAIVYSKISHKDWCDHDSAVAIWNLNRKDFNVQKPNMTIETGCCMTAVAFHPDIPAVLAGGNFNGEIMLWNIVKDDDTLMASSGASIDSHREPITGLYWATSSENKLKLISCSLDGKILIWKYKEKQNVLEPDDGFIVLAEHLPRNLGIKSTRPNAEVGVTSMSTNCEDPSIFIIGTEGGGLFQCSFNSSILAYKVSTVSMPLKSPITMTFESHKGYVTSVQFSPFSRNWFLTAGSDGELRIYTLLQPKPILTIQFHTGIQKAKWSPVRPLVIAAVSDDGQLHLWDLATDKTNPVESFPLSSEKCTGSTIIFDKENPQLLCTGSENGNSQIWQLGSSVTAAGSHEMEQLMEFAVTSE